VTCLQNTLYPITRPLCVSMTTSRSRATLTGGSLDVKTDFFPAMAPKATLSMLFHPKKGTKKENQANTPSPRKTPSAMPRPKVLQEDHEDNDLKLPDGPFQEFKLMSSALNGWKYDVMKFDSRKTVDVSRWTPPIKLNRKELRRDDNAAMDMPQAVGPMLGPDGKPVIGVDGKMVMVDAEGRPIQNADNSNGGRDGKGKGAAVNGKKRFQKKTRQVFYVPEEVRRLRREERYPWVMEDSSPAQSELWIGQMEDVAKSETHAFFMPAANDIFKFVPAHRWYKFQKKLKHDLPTDTANVESLVGEILLTTSAVPFMNIRTVYSQPETGSTSLAFKQKWQRTFCCNGSYVQGGCRGACSFRRKFSGSYFRSELGARWKEA